mgnify:CR=1 FL=1
MWLEEHLANYSKCLVVISHSEDFLNAGKYYSVQFATVLHCTELCDIIYYTVLYYIVYTSHHITAHLHNNTAQHCTITHLRPFSCDEYETLQSLCLSYAYRSLRYLCCSMHEHRVAETQPSGQGWIAFELLRRQLRCLFASNH